MSEKMKVIHALMEALRQRDFEGFLGHLTDDIEYHFHVGTRPLLGKDWVRKFLKKYDEQHSDVLWTISTFAETGDKLLVEGLEEYVERSGETVSHPYMGVFEFENGRIRAWREYFQM